MPGVTADDVYLSTKIPFAFDYAGKDAQVAPGSKWDAENLEHGTHVAGIAAGYAVDGEGAVTFSGVAPDAQVIPMKVFDDSGTGAATTTILAALEDAYRLGVDAVNLSLGSYGGFTVDEDALINDVYNKLDDAGIMVITAAGNETSSSYMNSYGTNAPLTGDPDNSVVAAPSVYPANLSIASVEGQEVYANYVLLGGEKITATATSTTQDTVQCFVTVVPKWYDGIQATQDTIHLKLGRGADLTQYLTLLDESGVVIPELNPVNYASLDESILSVDASGHVTALHTGTGMVRALLNTGDYALIAVEVTCDHDHTTRTETPAACTQDGSVTVTCDDCGAVLSTEAIPATGHDYKDGKCTVCGAADPDYRPEQPENPGQPEKPEKPEQPENPGVKTGDSGVLLYMGLMTVCALGACLTLRRRKAR